MTLTALDQLKNLTTIVADSSDLSAIEKFRPLDATTNPSLITAAASQVENKALIEAAYQQAQQEGYADDALIERTIDILTVKFGVEILKLIEGRVSTEVDASLSFDTAATIAKAKELLALYAQYGIDSDRILIKIASTWEGIQAARTLEEEGIHTNLTLLFGQHQAHACADAKVTLISPFVGRILDWYKKAEGVDAYPIEKDPGVLSVKSIYEFYKAHGIQTEIMGASFRSIDQVLGLSGCDLLTVAPNLLAELNHDQREVQPQLSATAITVQGELSPISQAAFLEQLKQDQMASELLQGGIQGFIKAREQLAALLGQTFLNPVES
ncbi:MULTISPECIES: transaldolase [Acinetobacter]|uniref:Transaldolase n=1 Tax=Acinetobacter pseudolwoffii TaxID=2053287 RepID=A0A2H9YQJ1_9GAMM|nr:MULTISPECIES: transaldolase [Acinetobacter]MDH5819343.1 transaldolase [Acinetobacter pseudolwoffii]MDM1323294.1 transaldolase [Acinetobacter pseudolwoffii]MDM1334835.1 transaldolase [Acinetobacter pseudolwoffii]PJO74899.1 transaldolase [Acinetobacter pseudolwoffii]HJE53599.1 transaldolase [Acinetobacter pseudolwoffii]